MTTRQMRTQNPEEAKQPKPEGVEESPCSHENQEQLPLQPLDPTRYGDWEKNGRCIDF
ncbi:MAG TPA: DUF1674 domain-containing protein [Methylothermaceae bacterium]|nr:DUF1674 domain-containing protein [Methylothermaceae bacterium]